MATATKFHQTWDLDSILPRPESHAFRETLDRFRADLEHLAERSEQLPPVSGDSKHASAWTELLKKFENVAGRMKDFDSFIGCYAAADAENKLYQRLEGQFSALEPLRERILTSIEFALKEADDKHLSSLIDANGWLREIAFFLLDKRKHAAMRLPKDQESLAADLGVDGLHAWGRLYDRVSGELRVHVMERGEIVAKSPGQVHFDSAERTVRENNFFAADKAWRSIGDLCADALNHISGTRLTLYRRLGLKDHLEAPLRNNRLERRTLDCMWSVVSQRKSVLVDFLRKKAELLGVDKLAWYDLQAPLPLRPAAGGSKSLSYDDACETIITTFDQFSPELGEFARRALADRWVEAENRSGKRQGGFCTGFSTAQQSRIFMTFTNTTDSMSTLAHELGHAYHSYVLRERPLFLRAYPMNLAETASTFAEAVLGEHRLNSCESPDEELQILDGLLSDAVVFLMNIHARFLFDDHFHRERANGELTASRFSELMLAAQKEAYQDALDDNGWNPSFWISKLHFYISTTPFYNFPYTFGYLLSQGLYSIAREGDADFAPAYRELLIATGCRETEDAVRSTLGYDLSGPDFWSRSIDIIAARVERFLALAGEPDPKSRV